MFYGWRIVAVAFVTNFIAVGLVFYSYGVFFKALAAEFGGSRFGVAAGLAIMNIAISVFAPFLGHAFDRSSIRHIICLGALLSAGGFFVASQIDALWQFYAVMGTFLALGVTAVGPLAGTTLVANWFRERRGVALGVAGMGISASGFAIAPLATLLIGAIGWRDTFLVYGAVPLLVLLFNFDWLRYIARREGFYLALKGAVLVHLDIIVVNFGVLWGVLAMAAVAFGIVIAKPVLLRSPVLWATAVRQAGSLAVMLPVALALPRRRKLFAVLRPSASWRFFGDAGRSSWCDACSACRCSPTDSCTTGCESRRSSTSITARRSPGCPTGRAWSSPTIRRWPT